MDEQLRYYLSITYPIQMFQEDDGSYSASIRDLGEDVVGFGRTPDEAINNVKLIKREVIEDMLRHGEEIPMPKRMMAC